MALSFTRPRQVQVPANIGPGSGGGGHRHGGRGLLVVLVDDYAAPGVLVDRGRPVVLGGDQPGYNQLGHGSLGAEHQLVHR